MPQSLRVVVVGAGLQGLASALLLARDGHRVTVLERDPAEPPPPEDAWAHWDRQGCVQFRLPHYPHARFRHLLEAELPDVARAIEAAGGRRHDAVGAMPEGITGGVRDGDDRFTTLAARRPVFEAVFARAAAAEPGVSVVRGRAVRGLLSRQSDLPGVPHVAGVVTDDGDEVRADLVIDAGGRRSTVPGLLRTIGVDLPQEDAEAGFVYYTRTFRGAGGRPLQRAGIGMQHDSVTLLTLPADNDTWSVVITASSRDKELRALRDPDRWTAAVRRYPLIAHWVDAEPITGVDVMGGLGDRIRHFMVDGRPLVTGLVAVGDAWAYTNPSIGRGMSMGLLHATVLRDALRATTGGGPVDVALRWAEATAQVVEPWYRATRATDEGRLAEIEGDRLGVPYAPDDPRWRLGKAMIVGAGRDPDVLRAVLEIGNTLTLPDDVFARPGFPDRALAAGADLPQYPLPGPDRRELLSVLEAVATG